MGMNRRSAIEPVISHLKYDHNMIRNFLKGKEGIVSMLSYPLLGLISLSSFELFLLFRKSYLFIVFIFNLSLVSFHF
ncbi:hypothetical protein LEP1GSC024_0688 [Leptospira noguchii str. 2001034031]|uniref:Uncharacterized protein n=2 Tax=Leptospira noguchii TaxID=28182 RepID=M6YCB0_9LEPT|nr:hypothetical protein LEP1GSC024_0688 [Leptospira noguchii str. 2001034031]